ncbi:hypothetical protein PRUPE_1G182500, partial [Prunus persica]
MGSDFPSNPFREPDGDMDGPKWLLHIYLHYFVHASKSGVAQETLQNSVHRSTKVITEQEARQILNVSERTTWEERYNTSFENNAENGTFYLESKVHKAKECLDAAYRDKWPERLK